MKKTILRPFVLAAIPALCFLSAYTGTAKAEQGDCGQPQSQGSMTTASDALAVLVAAVGLGACELCVCDVNDDGLVTASDALAVLNSAVGFPVSLDCPECMLGTTSTTNPTTTTSTTTTTTLGIPLPDFFSNMEQSGGFANLSPPNFLDFSGVQGSPTFLVAGKIGVAVDFGGASWGAANNLVASTGYVTYSFWFKHNSSVGALSANESILGVRNTGIPNDGFSVWIHTTGTLRLVIEDNTNTINSFPTGSTNVVDGQWHHVVAQLDPTDGTYELWLDGSIELSGTIGSAVGIGNVQAGIGAVPNIVPAQLDGSLDEVAWWVTETGWVNNASSRTTSFLTAAQVALIYELGSVGGTSLKDYVGF